MLEKKIILKRIKEAQNLKELDEIYQKYLGKKGEISRIFRSLKGLSKAKRVKIARETNRFKALVEKELELKSEALKKEAQKESFQKTKEIDVTRPGIKIFQGHLHPLTQVKRKVEEFFQSMGFSVVEGPEVETEWYNFDALNIPKEHPVRDVLSLGKTLYLKEGNLMRSHTSSVQIRYMEKNNPPLRIIVPGRVFRHEATDASHEVNFYQLEGLMIDEKGKVSAANFKAIIEEFFKRFFEKPIKIRLRSGYFPFTEPSFEVDLLCINCLGKGCSACQRTGWMEIMGAGMVHPAVIKNSGLNPKFWQGFAFGMGLDRLAMMKYKINDIRLFYSGDLRFLKQF